MEENIQNKNSLNDVVESNSTHILSYKEKDNRSDYFSERAKKLTTAVYLVTNLIPQNDPLRVYIRRYSIRLLSFVGGMPIGYSLSEAVGEIGSLSKKISEMLEIAFFSGYVSEMNFSVLKTEFDSFINEISDYDRFVNPINPSSLKVKIPSVLNASHVVNAQNSPKVGFKNPISDIQPEIKRRTATGKRLVEAKKTSRKEAILSIIKRRGTVSIKDVSSVILNCSEKTIQRELIALVEDGILKKSGDRRWSVYSLAN